MAVPTIWLFFVNAFVGDGVHDVPKLVFRQTQGLPKAAPTNVSNHNVNAYILYTNSIIFFGQNRKNAQNIPLVIVHRAEFVCYVLTFAHFDDIIYT